MKKIKFIITGNHKMLNGNPMPKLKMTGKQQWTPRAQEYKAWKSHVVTSLFNALSISGDNEFRMKCGENLLMYKKPFVTDKDAHACMSLEIRWSSGAHGDPENVFGSIADALFYNDKNLDVHVLSYTPKDKGGWVNVEVMLFKDQSEKLEFFKTSSLSDFTSV